MIISKVVANELKKDYGVHLSEWECCDMLIVDPRSASTLSVLLEITEQQVVLKERSTRRVQQPMRYQPARHYVLHLADPEFMNKLKLAIARVFRQRQRRH